MIRNVNTKEINDNFEALNDLVVYEKESMNLIQFKDDEISLINEHPTILQDEHTLKFVDNFFYLENRIIRIDHIRIHDTFYGNYELLIYGDVFNKFTYYIDDTDFFNTVDNLITTYIRNKNIDNILEND